MQRKRSAVRQFYRFCVAENICSNDPSRKIAAARKGLKLPKILSRDEVEALVRAQMGAAGDAVPGGAMSVPLDVSVGTGPDWHAAGH